MPKHYLLDIGSLPDEDEVRDLDVPQVSFSAVDFAVADGRGEERLREMGGTDVLVGVHGDGLVHAMYLRRAPIGGLVELALPEKKKEEYLYRNLAFERQNLYESYPVNQTLSTEDIENIVKLVYRITKEIAKGRVREWWDHDRALMHQKAGLAP
ncbi:hypothetical protein DFJ73DRAFT_868913 [Zopfochytrium polystomum]|nr:hypothetical protein DFJ73DRAFT_868913 [Zopfochytrium polystomum]